MDSITDVHVECARIQSLIEHHLGLKAGQLIFEYRIIDGKMQLDLITINPRHNQSFLFHTVKGYDKVDSLQRMLEYVKQYKEKESSYTLQWVAKGDTELHTSYFRAKNIYDALDKLYYGRDMNTITVFSVVLNPVA
jgi:hypothetical protein